MSSTVHYLLQITAYVDLRILMKGIFSILIRPYESVRLLDKEFDKGCPSSLMALRFVDKIKDTKYSKIIEVVSRTWVPIIICIILILPMFLFNLALPNRTLYFKVLRPKNVEYRALTIDPSSMALSQTVESCPERFLTTRLLPRNFSALRACTA